jgi:FPC/CPF motif-containing protein YcgG
MQRRNAVHVKTYDAVLDGPDSAQYPWVSKSMLAIQHKLDAPSTFPCPFARMAFKKKKLRYVIAGWPFDRDALRRVREGLLDYLSLCDTLSGSDAADTALLILFPPEPVPLTIEAYHQQAWMVMQDWINHDPHPWPDDIPLNPHEPMWSMCFRSVPLFVNVSCPAHVARKSRNLGPSLVLVTQPRAGFDRVAGHTPEGDKRRQRIRELMDQYDAPLPWPRELGTYHKGDPEWCQYVLQETNEPRTDYCPLVIPRHRRG